MKRLLLLCLDKGTWVLTQCPAIYSRRCVVGYEAKHPSKMNGAQWVDWHVMVISWWGEVRNRAPHCAINDDEPWFINIPKNMAMTSSTNEDSDDVDVEAWWQIWVMGCKGGTCPPPTWLKLWLQCKCYCYCRYSACSASTDSATGTWLTLCLQC